MDTDALLTFFLQLLMTMLGTYIGVSLAIYWSERKRR